MKTSTLVLFLPINSEPLYTLMGEHDSRHSSEFYVLTSKFRRIVLSTPLEIAHIILGLYRLVVNMRHKSIVSSDWSDTMVWFGQILLLLYFYHPIHMIIDSTSDISKDLLKLPGVKWL